MARRVLDGPINDNSDSFDVADDNVVQTFQLEKSQLRGRAVRLGSVLDEILVPHDYPAPVAHLVAESICLTALLSSMLKYEGIFTLQTKGDGPVSILVSDMMSNGDIRGCATFDKDRVARYGDDMDLLPIFLGKGYIAFTVDQKSKTDRYQGIVELKGRSLVECVQHYFAQSEQINTAIRLAVKYENGEWRGGGIMLQMMPEDPKNLNPTTAEDWNRATILLNSAKDSELVDPDLHSQALLLRLFHEEGVRVYKPLDIKKGCRCDADKVRQVLATLPKDDIEYLKDNGTIKMHCEFCSRDFVLEPDALNDSSSKVTPLKKKSPKKPKKK